MECPRWLGLLYLSLSIALSLVGQIPSAMTASTKYAGIAPALNMNLPLTTKEIRRLKAKGLEVVPSGEGLLTSNSVTSEPTCEELRAMWRYYKRQSRAAELTNQISPMSFPDLFWDIPGGQSSAQSFSGFGPMRSRNRPRFRSPKGSTRNSYGRVVSAPASKSKSGNNRDRDLRPVEEVVRILGPSTANQALLNNPERITEPKVHLAPPIEPTAGALSQLRDMYRGERLKAQGHQASDNSNGPPLVGSSRDYGKLILSPPQGDGRIANKPKELMSPFEKLRFHSEDLLGFGDEIDGRAGVMGGTFLTKRRNGFIGIPILDPRDRRPPVKIMKGKPEVEKTTPPRVFLGNDVALGAGTADDMIYPIGDYGFDPESADAEDNFLLRRKPEAGLPSCSQIEGQICSSNADCSCAGFGLYRCFMAQCQTLPLGSPDGEDWAGISEGGIWHPNALAEKHLGAWEQSPFPLASTRLIRASDGKRGKVFEGGSPRSP